MATALAPLVAPTVGAAHSSRAARPGIARAPPLSLVACALACALLAPSPPSPLSQRACHHCVRDIPSCMPPVRVCVRAHLACHSSAHATRCPCRHLTGAPRTPPLRPHQQRKSSQPGDAPRGNPDPGGLADFEPPMMSTAHRGGPAIGTSGRPLEPVVGIKWMPKDLLGPLLTVVSRGGFGFRHLARSRSRSAPDRRPGPACRGSPDNHAPRA